MCLRYTVVHMTKTIPLFAWMKSRSSFFSDFRKGFRSKKDGVQYEDYQYIRNGTTSIFLFTEPLAGWRYADAQERRTAQDWAKQIEWLLTKQYPMAKKIVLVMITSTPIELHHCMPPPTAACQVSCRASGDSLYAKTRELALYCGD